MNWTHSATAPLYGVEEEKEEEEEGEGRGGGGGKVVGGENN